MTALSIVLQQEPVQMPDRPVTSVAHSRLVVPQTGIAPGSGGRLGRATLRLFANPVAESARIVVSSIKVNAVRCAIGPWTGPKPFARGLRHPRTGFKLDLPNANPRT